MTRRTKLEIIYDILRSIQEKQGKIKPTHLLYKSNLSHKKMMEYVEELKQKGLIGEETIRENKFYILTDKGALFLQEFHRMKAFTESFGL